MEEAPVATIAAVQNFLAARWRVALDDRARRPPE
jgi:hypothetical protein